MLHTLSLGILSLALRSPMHPSLARAPSPQATALEASAPLFTNSGLNSELKMRLLTLAASLDRGQSYNPTSSDAYRERMSIATSLIQQLIAVGPPLPTTLAEIEGEWELVFTDVAHGIFRSSPFFLAIQQAYARAGEAEKAELFFKLHELQTWHADQERTLLLARCAWLADRVSSECSTPLVQLLGRVEDRARCTDNLGL